MRSLPCLGLLLFAIGAGCGPAPIVTSPLIVARPYDSHIPASYDPSKATPLVLLLHGYSATPFIEDVVFGLTAESNARGFLYAMPSGLTDSKGAPYWNATDACCDFDHTNVDDVAYLNAVIDDMEARYNVDKKRIFIAGHSNGGFMAHRMACDAAPRIAAIVSLAGAMWLDATKCKPTDKVAVLQVHGDADTEVIYNGTSAYPSATQTVADWAVNNGCAPSLTPTGMTLDLVSNLPGAETEVARHDGCAGGAAELWTIHGGSHVPAFNLPAWPDAIYNWMAAHPKP